jgi:D-lactate dehydrogenase (cytochrome)
MGGHLIEARPPRDPPRRPAIVAGDEAGAYLRDAAHTPGGFTPLVALPATEGEVAWVLREAPAVLPVGAQSSLTGGATPFGEWVLSTARLAGVGPLRGGRLRAGAGVALTTLADALAGHALFFPPTPTFDGAFLGGAASTNAAGAATFKYGSTRAWIHALTVVLASGDVLDVERGGCRADRDGYFEVSLTGGERRRVPVPAYVMPAVAKRSAGYHAEPDLDLVDLFVGAEGTLGVITEVEVRAIPAPARFFGWIAFDSEARALATVGRLREASRRTWAAADPRGIDVAAIESLDRRCLELLREDGLDREHGVRLPPSAEAVLVLQAELPPGTGAGLAMDELAALDDDAADAPDTPLTRLCRLLREEGALDELEVALPGDARRARQFLALREAVPTAVNHRIGDVQRTRDPQVRKTAGDMIVPFDRLPLMMTRYREAFARRGLDHALWGHVSDGNIHANVIPRSAEDVRRGDQALLELGDEAIRLGGCPLSEHGVGRSPVKQELLRRLYGDAGIAAMRRVKAALDPEGKLAPGVLFPRAVSPPGPSRRTGSAGGSRE